MLRPVAFLVLIGVLSTGCSSDGTETTETTTGDVFEPSETTTTEVSDGGDIAIPELAEGEVPVGPYYDGVYTLDIGDCFNLVRTTSIDGIVDFILRISCDLPHDHELFFDTFYPADSDDRYPGEDAVRAWSLQACYAAFETFVGVPYEESVYEIGYDHPTQEYFEDSARSYRGVRCWITTPEEERTGTASAAAH